MSDKTFRLDNIVIEAVPTLFGTTKKSQLYLPGMEPFGTFDLWATLACYSLLDPAKPAAPVTVTLTDFVELLNFSRTISEALGHYRTFPSDAYAMVRESLHRLFTVEAVFAGDYQVKTGKRGRPRKQVVEYHFRIITSYKYIYPAGTILPDQLPESRRRNVNRAKTLKGEEGPPIWASIEGPKPDAVEFRVSEELIRGLTKEDPHIGATILRHEIFKLRRRIPPRDTTTVKTLLFVCRQISKTWRITLDKLVARMKLDPANTGRNRTTVLRSLSLLQSLGVIEGFSHNPKTDVVTIEKADDWHFPAPREGEGDEVRLLP